MRASAAHALQSPNVADGVERAVEAARREGQAGGGEGHSGGEGLNMLLRKYRLCVATDDAQEEHASALAGLSTEGAPGYATTGGPPSDDYDEVSSQATGGQPAGLRTPRGPPRPARLGLGRRLSPSPGGG